MNSKSVVAALLGMLAVIVAFTLLMNHRTESARPGVKAPVKFSLPELSDSDFDWVAARIYQNEASGNPRYLTWWGEGEDFPSFGIGHFIWFPAGVDAPFDETFPALVAFLQRQSPPGLQMPGWLRGLQPFKAPWTNKQQFDRGLDSVEMAEMRRWLESTRQLQARFIATTFEQRWRNLGMLTDQYQQLTALLQELAGTAQGLFAVIDYYNFKGLGKNPRERYQGKGWGLLQVLQLIQTNRDPTAVETGLVEQFRQAAEQSLRMRVKLSPPERQETRWLDGWLKRLQGYVEIDAHRDNRK